MFKQMQAKAAELGYRKGESAAEFQKRDPKAAAKYARFLKRNHKAIVSAIADRI